MINEPMKNTEIPSQSGLQFFSIKGQNDNLTLFEKTTLAPSQAFKAWKIHCANLQWTISWSTVHLHRVVRPKSLESSKPCHT